MAATPLERRRQLAISLILRGFERKEILQQSSDSRVCERFLRVAIRRRGPPPRARASSKRRV